MIHVSLQASMNTGQSGRVPKNHNVLLELLCGTERDRIFSRLEWVPLHLGGVLCEAGQTFSHAYFPTDAIVSILYVLHNADSAGIAVVGREGMIGMPLFMGGDSTPVVVLCKRRALHTNCQLDISKEFASGGTFQRILLRFAQALITQTVQTAACNRHHSVEQQLCRWLLLSLDRLKCNRMTMSQRLIGNMLGINSTVFKAAASALQKAGLISCDDRQITVLHRAGV